MFKPARFRALMEQLGLSQSELARRVGISQASIQRLVSGQAYGSKHLHRIARELRTTPAYLSGETDDPHGDAPDIVTLDSATRDLIDCLAEMDRADRAAFIQIGRSLARRQSGSTLHSPGREYRGE